MKEIEKLNLKDVEVLDTTNLRSFSSYYTTGTDSSGGSESGGSESGGSESGGWIGCPDNECKEDSDCGYGTGVASPGVCNNVKCGYANLGFYKKCEDMNEKEGGCERKKWGDKCSYYQWKENKSGTLGYFSEVEGTCQSYGGKRLICTTLNSSPGRG